MHSTYAPELTQWQNDVPAVTEPEVTQFHSTLQSTPMEQQEEDPWGVWPYVWVVDLHAFSRQRFHSFHGRFIAWRMERHNRRQQKLFCAQHGFRPSEDEMGLELL